MAALLSVFKDRSGVVFAEIVDVEAAAVESASFVKGNLACCRVTGPDFEDAESRFAGRSDGVLQRLRGR